MVDLYPNKSIAEKLIKAFFDYDEFIGPAQFKHKRFCIYHKTLVKALSNTSELIYP